MPLTTLTDGTSIHCLHRSEALVLDGHVAGYFDHGVTLRDGDTVVDVGANVGVFAIRAAQRFPGVRVIALEPVPAIFEVLARNAALHGAGRITALRCGAASKPGETSFTYYPNSPALSTAHPELFADQPGLLESAVAGTLDHPADGVWYARFVPTALSGLLARYLKRGAERVTAPLVPVSQLIREHGLERVDLLKVDCEGGELETLLGIDEGHWPRVRQVVTEVHDVGDRLTVVTDLLRHAGLDQVTVVQEPGFEGTPLHNVFAVRTQGLA